MCGLIGYVSTKKDAKAGVAVEYVINQYQEQHHRGKEGFGITGIDDSGQIQIFRATEPVKMMVDLYIKAKDMKHILLHHRNPTSTGNSLDQTHPMIVSNKELKLDWIVNHNGVIRNAKDRLFDKHKKLGYEYTTHYEQYVSEYSKTTMSKFNDSESFAIEFARFMEGLSESIETEGAAAFLAVATDKKTGKVVKIVIGTNGQHPLKVLEIQNGVGFASLEDAGEPIGEKKSITFTPEYSKSGKLIRFNMGKEEEVKFYDKPIVAVTRYHASDHEDSLSGFLGKGKTPPGFHDRTVATGKEGVVHTAVSEPATITVADKNDYTKVSVVVNTLRTNNFMTDEEGKTVRLNWRLMDVADVHTAWSDAYGHYCLIDVAKKAYAAWKEAYAKKQDIDHRLSKEQKEHQTKIDELTEFSEFTSYAQIIEYVSSVKQNKRLFNDNATHEAFNEFDVAKFSTEFMNGRLKEAQEVWDEFMENALVWLEPDFVTEAMEPQAFLDNLPPEKSIFTTDEILGAAKNSVDRRMARVAKDLVPLFKLEAWAETIMNIGWQFQIKHDAEEAVSGLIEDRFSESKAPAPAPVPAPVKTLHKVMETNEENRLEDAKTEAGAALSALAEMAETESPETIYREAEEVVEKINFIVQAETLKQMREASALAAEQGVAVKVGFPLLDLQESIKEAQKQLENVASIVNATKSREEAEGGLAI